MRKIILVFLFNLFFSGFLKADLPFVNPGDTNFTYEKYEDFLRVLTDKSRFKVVPLHLFSQTIDSGRIVVGLRHDIDNNLQASMDMARIEKRLGFSASYYFLHTASYYYSIPGPKGVRSPFIVNQMLQFQDEWGHEVGLHNDLVTLKVIYRQDPVVFLRDELNFLRKNGLRIWGTAAHGSPYAHKYKYINYYFFEEFSHKPFRDFTSTKMVITEKKDTLWLEKGRMADFNLEYEAYFLNNNKYYSDAQFVNGRRWNFSNLRWDELKKGDRVIFLIHPEHWYKSSNKAEFLAFKISEELRPAVIDPFLQTVTIDLPRGIKMKELTWDFTLSEADADIVWRNGARKEASPAKVFRGKDKTETHAVLISQDGKVHREWTVKLNFFPNNKAEIISIVSKSDVGWMVDPRYWILTAEGKLSRSKPLPIQIQASRNAKVFFEGKLLKKGKIILTGQEVFQIEVVSEDESTRRVYYGYVCYDD